MSKTEHREFTVISRGPSAAIFAQGEELVVSNVPSAFGPVTATYRTRWLQSPEGVLMPGNLWIEVRGRGSCLEDVLAPFANAGLFALPPMSLCSNAAIANPELEVAFESTPGAKEREYFQSYVAPELPTVWQVRRIPISLFRAVYESLTSNDEVERLFRAAEQYRVALDSWKMGLATFSIAHLWMAVEALTKVYVRIECGRRGCTNQAELADVLKIQLKGLDSEIRKRLIFNGDSECYAAAKNASDGFEHGFLHADQIAKHAVAIRTNLANYVRNAILNILSLESDCRVALLGSPYDRPRGHWPLICHLRGRLLCDGDNLAAAGQKYPFIRWSPHATDYKLDGSESQIQMNHTITPELADGVSFLPGRLELRSYD